MKLLDLALIVLILWIATFAVIFSALEYKDEKSRSLKCESLGYVYVYVDGKCLIVKEHPL